MKLKTLDAALQREYDEHTNPGLSTGNPYGNAPSRKDGSDVGDELKELIDDLADKVVKAKKEVADKQKEIDGSLAEIQKQRDSDQAANVETRDEFQKKVEKLDKLEKDMDDAMTRLDTMIEKGTSDVPEHWSVLAANCEKLADYSGGSLELLKHEGPAFTKDIFTTPGSAGSLLEPFRRPGILTPVEQPLTIRDLLTVVRTTAGSIKWAKELLFTNNAAMQTAEGAAKAKSDLTFTEENSTVQTLAHWFAVSRQVLADAPSLQDYIVNRGTYGLKLKEEEQLLAGDGTGKNLTGILPQATPYDTTLGVAADTGIDRLLRSVLQVRKAFLPADTYVLTPTDWVNIQLTKTSDLAYVFANPADPTTPRLWGRRVVESDSMPDDTFLTAAMTTGATLWDRELLTVRVSEHHAGFFIENMVAILIEERLALTVERPEAFVMGTFA